MTTQVGTDRVMDTIEREILINAPIETVWSLVAKTGFWVGEELQFGHDGQEGQTIQINSRTWGIYPVHVERLSPPSLAVYRWASCFPGEEPVAGKSTRVEFTLTQQDDGVLVRVRESGFSQIDVTDDVRAEQFRGNTEGWDMQMAALKRAAEGVAA